MIEDPRVGVVASESIDEAGEADDEEIDLRTSSAVLSANIIRSYLEHVSIIKIRVTALS